MPIPSVAYRKLYDNFLDNSSLTTLEKYYRGFGYNKRGPMFEEELKDLEGAYVTTLKSLHKEVEDVLPSLLHYMEEFITLHKQNAVMSEKLDVLREKMGIDPKGESNE